jgi:LPS-assembly lipoprotein
MLAALPLAACGLAPVYAPGGAATGLRGAVAAAEPRNPEAYDLVVRLEERLGRPTAPAFDLSYEISLREIDLAISQANAITRYNVEGEVSYSLTRRADEAVVSEGKLRSFTSYAASGTTVATDAARIDARRRLMRLLADQMVTHILGDVQTGAARP